MRITTKLTLGFSFLIAILLAAHLYQERLIRRMGQVQEELSQLSFDAGLKALGSAGVAEDLMGSAELYLSYGGEDNRADLHAARADFDERLHVLQELTRQNDLLSAQVAVLEGFWIRIQPDLKDIEEISASASKAERNRLWKRVSPRLEALLDEAKRTVAASDRMIQVGVDRSHAMAARVNLIARATLFVALGLALAVTVPLFRSITRSLRQLTAATRRVANGDFSYKVDESGGDELAELASYFNRMAHRLGELDQLKRDFISWVSHDLRAPLASIQETSRLLLDQFSDELEAPQKRLLELNLASAQRLSEMILNLLDLSAIEAGVVKYEFESVDVGEILEGVAGDFHGLILDKKLDLVSPDGTPRALVRADPVRLRQVLGNLLSNAIKFSPERGTIRLSVRTFQKLPAEVPADCASRVRRSSDGYCWIGVSDEGPGVPADLRDKIFDRFYQADQRPATGRQGTGLGLAIARRIVEAHEGAIWVVSNADRGSTFFVLLRCSGKTPAKNAV